MTELKVGYELLPNDNLEYSEHSLVQRKQELTVQSVKKSAPRPETITDEELKVLIGTYVYGYIDKPKNVPIHTRQLLSALLELKDKRCHNQTKMSS